MTRPLTPDDRALLQFFLANRALEHAVSPTAFFRALLKEAELPKPWILDRVGIITGASEYDAGALITWAENQGTVPGTSWSTLGALLRTLLKKETLGLEGMALVTAFIDGYELCKDKQIRESFRRRYGVPCAARPDALVEIGPEFTWRGPVEELELQAFFRAAPVQFDMRYVAEALKRARSVCRLTIPGRQRTGSGVLIAPGLVLTNHHVVFGIRPPYDAVGDVVPGIKVDFEGIALWEGDGNGGATFALDNAEALVAQSLPLDYALLRLPRAAMAETRIVVAERATLPLEKGGALNLLHHPEGDALSITFGNAAVTGIYKEEGLTQYATVSAGGSSGAPAFDGEWGLAALHHGVRAKPFGRVGEGILLPSILKEITVHL